MLESTGHHCEGPLNKKQSILKTATRLFAEQGYEATTTLQVAMQIGITEPSVYYYYKNKTLLFSAVLELASNAYKSGIDVLKPSDQSCFSMIEALIRFHTAIIDKNYDYMRILLRTCPKRLSDENDHCTKIYRDARAKLKELIGETLKKGINTKEFNDVDVDPTSNMLIALIILI